jgi:hypothetical protein
MSETALSRTIRERLALERDVLVWRNNTGRLPNAQGQWITFGLGEGSADLVGLVAPSGRFFSLEIKTATGRVTSAQVQWGRAVRARGGFVAVVRSVDESMAALERCRAGAVE